MPYLGSKPADKALEADDIAANAVTTAKIADDAVDRDKVNLVSTSGAPSLEAKGDGSSQDGYIQLNCSQNSHGIKLKSPPHSAGQSYTLTYPSSIVNNGFMKTDSSGNLSFSTSVGSYNFLSEFTASSSASAEFTSLITSDFDDYLFLINGLVPATDGTSFKATLSTDNGSSYLSSNYGYVVPVTYFIGASGNGGNNESSSSSDMQLTAESGSDSDSGLTGNLWLWNVNDSAKRTCMYLSFLTEQQSNIGAAGHGWAFQAVAATHDAVKFNFASGNMASGTIKMYGIKNS